MGFFDTLFGTKPKTKIEQKSTLTPEQQARSTQLSGMLAQPYEGGTAPDLSKLESTSLAGLEQLALNAVNEVGTGAERPEVTKLLEILNAGPQDTTNLLDTIASGAQRDLERYTLPELDRKFANDFFSSDRVQRERDVLSDFTRTMAETRAGTEFQARQSQVQNALAAAGLLKDARAAPTNELMQLLAAGAVPRGVEQAKMDAQYQQYKDRINAMLGYLGIPQMENIVINTPGSKGLLGGAAEAFASAYGAKLA